MASVIGVSSSLQALSLEVSRRIPTPFSAASACSPSSSCANSGERAHFLGIPMAKNSSNRTVQPLCSLKRDDSALNVQMFSTFLPSHDLKSSLAEAPAAVASTNTIISEDAFKGLGLSSSGLNLETDYDFDDGSDTQHDADDLAISKLNLPQELVQALAKRGITHLFPIQRAVLVPALEGRDIIARAKTGTGKTLAFGIPIIQRLTMDNEENKLLRRSGRLPRVLVLAPTRELAKQVEKEIKESAPFLLTVCIYGGVSYGSQQNALTRGVDVVVGTPGRIIDLVKNKTLKLHEVQFVVLDEADQMLAVGFEEDVEVILDELPTKRQGMLFSATMPGWVQKLARKHLSNPMIIDLVGDRDEKLAEGIKLHALATTATSKRSILGDLITVYAKGGKTIVFTQTKRDADDVSSALTSTIPCEALHGDISQHQRERTLKHFREGKFSVLVATDVAARGLDVPNVDLVIHYELPNDPETFVHRSGRTGRAGKEGIAILMYTSRQKRTVKSLERDVTCRFEYISPPQVEDVLESSAHQVVNVLGRVHPELIEIFLPTAKKLMEEKGTNAFAAALAHLSGFTQPPSSRSVITHEEPSSDRYGRYSGRNSRNRSSKGGRGRNDSRKSNSWGERSYEEDNLFGAGRKSKRNYEEDNWSGVHRESNKAFSMGDRDRNFRGACFICGQSGHRALDCPSK
eukprot:Gb_35745 [translate_table: standard]